MGMPHNIESLLSYVLVMATSTPMLSSPGMSMSSSGIGDLDLTAGIKLLVTEITDQAAHNYSDGFWRLGWIER